MTLKSTPNENAHIIVIGNEKGGAGKTTTAMHIAMSLLYDGFKVSTIDIDSRQRSFSNYLENRRSHIANTDLELPSPTHFIVNKSRLDSEEEAKIDERYRFIEYLNKAASKSDFVIVDSPGSDTYLSRAAHSYADTIVTPINDSFVDLNLLAKINNQDFSVERHGIYSEMVWEAKIYRAQRDNGEIDWIISRNRLSSLDAHNKRNMAIALENLSKRVGCKVAKGFSERVIYRELFLQGLTLLDLINEEGKNLKLSHVTARQELRQFMDCLQLNQKLKKLRATQNKIVKLHETAAA